MKNLKTLWKLIVAFSLKIGLFMLLLAVCYHAFVSMVAIREWVIHTYESLEKVNIIHRDLLNIEAGAMRFAVTGRESALEPLQRGRAGLSVDLDALGALLEDNSGQQRNLEVLRRQTRQWIESQIDPLIALRREIAAGRQGEQAIEDFLATGQGVRLYDALRRTLDDIGQEERRLLEKRRSEMEDLQQYANTAMVTGGGLTVVFGFLLSFLVALSITRPLEKITGYARRIARGETAFPIEIDQRDEVGVLAEAFRDLQRNVVEKTRVAEAIAAGDLDQSVVLAGDHDTLGRSINRMTKALLASRDQDARTDWIKTGLHELTLRAAGETDPARLADRILGVLTPYLGAQAAALDLVNAAGGLSFQAGYALGAGAPTLPVPVGEGLAGRAVREGDLVLVDDVPDACLRVNTSFGDIEPRHFLALPFAYQGSLVGVLEIGSCGKIPEQAVEFLRRAAEPLAVTFDVLRKQARVRELLERTQEQAQKLQEQQEELKASNEELEEHAQTLQRSEEELRQQQEELQALNEELEEKNKALEATRVEVERKAADLETASRYKSEFLANMSHELRTPLNSLLLLSRNLRDNGSGRLSADEVEAAGIIYKNGADLLTLINDILDLSKVEAGKLSLTVEEVALADVVQSIRLDFGHVAEAKGVALETGLEEGLPRTIRTDRRRLEQILRNLVSNALKFTERGSVALRIRRPEGTVLPHRPDCAPGGLVAFSVIDTGIGIPAEKHQAIFEAFQQGDGSTSRQYGGTGLGLSITRELARLLGGRIVLESEPGRGSTFTLLLPVEALACDPAATPGPADPWAAKVPDSPHSPDAPVPAGREAAVPAAPRPFIPDDRDAIADGDTTILIIEDDPDFAGIIAGLTREKGFRAVAAATGEEGLALAERYQPAGIILDIRLPGISGWTVLGSLKRDHKTRHIPVHVVSVHDAPRDALDSQIMGAIGFLNKPVDSEDLEQAFEKIASINEKRVKDLLLVEDNPDLRTGIRRLVADLDVNVTEADTGAGAMAALAERRYDCMILDIGLADMNGFSLLKRLEEEKGVFVPPVIVYTGRDLTREEERELYRHADSIIIKGARSEERLLDEITLFLHRMVSDLPQSKQRMLQDLHNRDAALEGKTVLIVDDDMRNLFALSKVLTEKGLRVLKADNGRKALEVLDADPGVDAVVMDIMMPGMDGYEAMRRIREQPRFAELPLIALTAKAMKEDREKCLAAGASDYLSKPVDVDKMLSLLRVWLYGR